MNCRPIAAVALLILGTCAGSWAQTATLWPRLRGGMAAVDRSPGVPGQLWANGCGATTTSSKPGRPPRRSLRHSMRRSGGRCE